jgi:hypothetical protein
MAVNVVLAKDFWKDAASTWIDDLKGWEQLPDSSSSSSICILPDFYEWLRFNNLKCKIWTISFGVYKDNVIISFERNLTDEELIEFKFRWEAQQ